MEQSRWASPQPNKAAKVTAPAYASANTSNIPIQEDRNESVPTNEAEASTDSLKDLHPPVSTSEDPSSIPLFEPGPPITQYNYDYSLDASDAFAQTRPPDDLFSDELTPISDPVAEALPPSSSPPKQIQSSSGRGVRAPRGRGSTTGRNSRSPRTSLTSSTPVTASASDQVDDAEGSSATPNAAVDGATPKVTSPTASVRGPRHLTGGPAPAKLSDNELTARIAAIRLKNDQRLEKHARASADQAEALERELQAVEKAKEDRKKSAESAKRDRENRAKMDVERERNRARKAKAMEGREWDAGKEEQQASASARAPRRGMHGGIVHARGGRGRGGSRIGEHVDGQPAGSKHSREQQPLKAEDFPALGGAKASPSTQPQLTDAPVEAPTKSWADDVPVEGSQKPSWADEMDRTDALDVQR